LGFVYQISQKARLVIEARNLKIICAKKVVYSPWLIWEIVCEWKFGWTGLYHRFDTY